MLCACNNIQKIFTRAELLTPTQIKFGSRKRKMLERVKILKKQTRDRAAKIEKTNRKRKRKLAEQKNTGKKRKIAAEEKTNLSSFFT